MVEVSVVEVVGGLEEHCVVPEDFSESPGQEIDPEIENVAMKKWMRSKFIL